MVQHINAYTLTQDLILRNAIYHSLIRITCVLDQSSSPVPYSHGKTHKMFQHSLYGFERRNSLLESAQGYLRDGFLLYELTTGSKKGATHTET